MSEEMEDISEVQDDGTGQTPSKAPKDRQCQFCGVAFTASSLGRHLDGFIKDKRPKPPDGIHLVDDIRRIRGNVTRRQPRKDLKRSLSTSHTPGKQTSDIHGEIDPQSRAARGSADGNDALDKYPFKPSWEATGVINDLEAHGEQQEQEQGQHASLYGTPGRESVSGRPAGPLRSLSRQVLQKSQLDARQKLMEEQDNSRAAELALREIISSWRAAKLHIDMHSTPFDFEPLSLDFPALVLQCLRPPPTLFSSTVHPTSTSWSVQPPDSKQYEALRAYFTEEFRKYRMACQSATTAFDDDISYHTAMATHPLRMNSHEGIARAQKSAKELEAQVTEHLHSTWAVWHSLPLQRQSELWTVELARSIGRKQDIISSLREEKHSLKQEISALQSQVDNLSHLQQPKEFKMHPPTIIPFDTNMVTTMLEMAERGQNGVGFSLADRHLDLNTIVARSIDRWKNVIVSGRSASVGMGAQRPLDSVPPSPGSHSSAVPPAPPAPPAPLAPIPPVTSASSVRPASALAQAQAQVQAQAQQKQQLPLHQQQQQQQQQQIQEPQPAPGPQPPKHDTPQQMQALQQKQQAPPKLSAPPSLQPQQQPPSPTRPTTLQQQAKMHQAQARYAQHAQIPRPLVPNANSANFAPNAVPGDTKPGLPMEESSDRDADGDADMEDDDSFTAVSHSSLEVSRTRPLQPAHQGQAQPQQQQHQPQAMKQQPQTQQQQQQQQQQLHAKSGRISDETTMEGRSIWMDDRHQQQIQQQQRHQSHQHPPQQQHAAVSTQRIVSNEARSQYMINTSLHGGGSATTSPNHAMTMSRSLSGIPTMHPQNVMPAANHLGMQLGNHDEMYIDG